MGTASCGVVDTTADSCNITCSIISHNLYGKNQSIRVGTSNANTIITNGGSNTRTVCAVTVAVHTVANDRSSCNEIPTVDIIHITVVVIVFIVSTGSLVWICPNIVGKVGVRDVNTSIKNCYNRAGLISFWHLP